MHKVSDEWNGDLTSQKVYIGITLTTIPADKTVLTSDKEDYRFIKCK